MSHTEKAPAKHPTTSLRRTVDLALAVLLVLQLALPYLGEFAHEWLGVVFGVLCLVHLVINRKLFTTLHHTHRWGRAILDWLLVAWLILEMLSGLGMSLYVTPWLTLPSTFLLSRSFHGTLGYWGLLLAGFHCGLHAQAIRAQAAHLILHRPAHVPSTPRRIVVTVAGAASALILDFPEHLVPGRMVFATSLLPAPLYLALLALVFWGAACASALIDAALAKKRSTAQ